jgi:hypothetical protein
VKPEFIPAGELAGTELDANPEKAVLGKVVEANKALLDIPADDRVDRTFIPPEVAEDGELVPPVKVDKSFRMPEFVIAVIDILNAVLVASETLNDCNERIELSLCVVVIKEDELFPGLVSGNPKEAVYVLPEFTAADTTVKFPMPDIVFDVPEDTNVVPNESAFVSTELVTEGSVPAPVGPVTVLTEFPSDINDTKLFKLPEDVIIDPV